jgi:hypothetical protein
LRAGLVEATHPLLAYAPCHPSYPPEELKRFLAEIDRVHLISGFRAGRPMPAALLLGGFCWRLLLRLLFAVDTATSSGWLGWRELLSRWAGRWFYGVRMRDVNCPFRLFRRSIFARIPIQSDGEFAHTEILAKANFTNCLIGEEISLPALPEAGHRRPRDRKQWRRDAQLVFRKPDFGPVFVPPEPEPPPPEPPPIPPEEAPAGPEPLASPGEAG